jgi:hypothetical protein
MVDCLRSGKLWLITAANGDDSLVVPAASLKGASMDNFSIHDPDLMLLAAEKALAEHKPVALAVRKVREKYQHEIENLPGVKPRLKKLQATGIKPERVLKCLAALVILEKDATWRNDTEEIKTTLRELGSELRRMADEVERIYGSDTIRPDLYALSLGFLLPPLPPHDARKTVERMRETVADLEAKAAAFGQLRKQVSPRVKRAPVVDLLRHVSRPQPWSVPECALPLRLVLAELLYAVCQRYEIKNSFTTGSLRKTFKRHVLVRSPKPRLDKTPSQK